MKALYLIPFFMTLGFSKTEGPLKDVSQLRWTYRLIIAHTDTDPEPWTNIFSKHEQSITERHIAWFVIGKNLVVSNLADPVDPRLLKSLKKTYPTRPGEVLLIGKDSGVKVRQGRLDLPALFDAIDTMPMRRAEMRGKD